MNASYEGARQPISTDRSRLVYTVYFGTLIYVRVSFSAIAGSSKLTDNSILPQTQPFD